MPCWGCGERAERLERRQPPVRVEHAPAGQLPVHERVDAAHRGTVHDRAVGAARDLDAGVEEAALAVEEVLSLRTHRGDIAVAELIEELSLGTGMTPSCLIRCT